MVAGQKVFVERIGNCARNRDPDDLVFEGEVEKVGRDYFYLKGFTRSKFSKTTMTEASDYSANYKVYESLQAIEDKNEYNKKLTLIRKTFDSYGRPDLTLDQLRKICEIIG
jgi:hypothetical protein